MAAWTQLIESLPHATCVVELASLSIVSANRAATALLGLAPGGLSGRRIDDLLATPEDIAFWAEVATGCASRLRSDSVVCSADAGMLHVERSITLLGEAGGGPARHAVVSLRDRSSEWQAENRREELVAELQATLESTADGILVTDMAGCVRAFNRRFAQIWAVPDELLKQRDDGAIGAWMQRSVTDPDGYERRLGAAGQAALQSGTERLQLQSGRVLERVTRPLCSRGRTHGRVDSFRDLTERIAADQRIEKLSLTDALTGLPNRRQLGDRVGAAAARSRHDGRGFALLMVDLDRFRQINDGLGHDTGDRVLIDVARRIQRCLRTLDVLARVGGDQFAVLVHQADAAAAEATARRVLNVVALPCSLDGAQFTLTCSIGVALCPGNGNDIDELMRHAETAVRAVKAGGRASYRFPPARAEGDLRSHMRLDHAMRQALVSGRFRLHYQPKIRLSDGAVVGAEALIRWRDPELGDVPPARFIAVAEESGFIMAIGDWVLSQAVRQAALWHFSGRGLPIAINVSALQFQQSHFVDRIASVLAVSGLPPRLLELELTESILVRDADEALQRLHALARLGVRTSIDDFGTGYSSLSYLKRFPIGTLKIDRSFVNGLPADDSDVAIVRAILQLAGALGKNVVAEGVETELQRDFLQLAGCTEAQGHLYAPALDGLSFEKFLPHADNPAPRQPPPSHPHIRLVR